METLEEALEQAKKELEEEGTYRMPTTAYPEEEWEEQKVKGWPRPLHIFGVRQNQVNMRISSARFWISSARRRAPVPMFT